jgi:hypothetical protein
MPFLALKTQGHPSLLSLMKCPLNNTMETKEHIMQGLVKDPFVLAIIGAIVMMGLVGGGEIVFAACVSVSPLLTFYAFLREHSQVKNLFSFFSISCAVWLIGWLVALFSAIVVESIMQRPLGLTDYLSVLACAGVAIIVAGTVAVFIIRSRNATTALCNINRIIIQTLYQGCFAAGLQLVVLWSYDMPIADSHVATTVPFAALGYGLWLALVTRSIVECDLDSPRIPAQQSGNHYDAKS